MPVRRITVAFSFALGLGAALAAVAGASSLGSAEAPGLSAAQRAQLQQVNFVNACGFSHASNDDPIVFPGEVGRSHHHSFVGNRTTNAFSTLDSLLAGESTCDRKGHTAAYWMPSLVVNGTPVMPLGSTIYYRRRTLERVRPFPQDFRMIAGDSLATAPQDKRVTFWNCGVEGGVAPSSTVPTCPDGRRTSLRLHVTFPACWDGRSLDSPDHRSHVRYADRGRCTATHPVAVPAVTVVYRYPAIPAGASVALASGGQFSGHADFVNAWHRGTLQSLVSRCLNALRHCGRGS